MKKFWVIGCISMAFAIGFGAFGAHALEGIEPRLMAIWQKAVNYHTVHSLGVLLLVVSSLEKTKLILPLWLMVFGTLLFSGSLYSYVMVQSKWLVMLTPLGGMLFIVSWVLAALVGYQHYKEKREL